MAFLLNAARVFVNSVFRFRHFQERKVKEYASKVSGKRILEIGSGVEVDGKRRYSMMRFFDASNDFIQSELDGGGKIRSVDVTNMGFDCEFEVILCLNVLEHVFEFDKAIDGLYRALKPGGRLMVVVPTIYPLHFVPHDYWRFTEYSLRLLFEPRFKDVVLSRYGPRRCPMGYFLTAVKRGDF